MEVETGGGDGSETGSVMEPEGKQIDASLTQVQREEQQLLNYLLSYILYKGSLLGVDCNGQQMS